MVECVTADVDDTAVQGFSVIMADPPWRFKSNSVIKPGRNSLRHYKCPTLEQLCTLPLKERVAKNAVLFLWIPSAHLVAGHHKVVAKAWGFTATAMGFVWVKLHKGCDPRLVTPDDLHMSTGLTTRKNTEFCVLCKRGRSLRRDRGVLETIISPIRQHSRKPDAVYGLIERYVGNELGPYLELFARQRRPGWVAWGDEVDKFAPITTDGVVLCHD